ncbi:PAS domain S-box-containing protein [Blastococcus aurantiacus]|uniref:PAS domain S-box-containing protein n=1 Tax=Blastococcus aurantiacus TaxID=1550231 RepID=A0A1G7I4Y0_9ACTN|nr:SpoIIE family protein phosphatase [Blastococcus aurantiacus]SDF07556.1 PAS domain S-box-containing protein [Blastococcus aurantiacus]
MRVPRLSDSGESGPEEHGRLDHLLEDDPADLYENAPMGYLSTLPGGRIVKVNRTFCDWIGRPAGEVLGANFQDLLSMGGRVYYETHLIPLLRMQGAVREIALDLVRADGTPLACLANAVELRDDEGAPLLMRATLFEATARRRYERELLTAQRNAEESELRSLTLQMVVSDLAAAISVRDVASVIVERSREALHARGAALVLVETDAHDPEALPALRPVRSHGLPDNLLPELRDAAGSQLAVELARGVRSIVLGDRLRSGQPALSTAMAAGRLTELVIVPVTADGRRLGVLVLALGEGVDDLISLEQPGSAPTLATAEINLLSTIGRQAGQALERARLHEETARQAERASFLLEAARLLAEAADVAETVDRLAGLVVTQLADLCVVDLDTDGGLSRPAVRHRDPQRAHLAEQLRTHHLPRRSTAHPSVRALRTGRTEWIRTVDDEFLRSVAVDDAHLEVMRALDLTAVVAVPLIAEGRQLGVLTIAADARRGPFTVADVEVAEQLALQVGLVVARAQRFDLAVRTSHALQANLLPPPPPSLEGLAIAVRYLPATYGVDVGGDFYDVVRLPGVEVGLAVGDVVGHDITAAATMGQLRSVYRALLADGPAPGDVIDRLQAGWPLLSLRRMATALFASLEPASGRLRIASAGHPPPVLLSDGRAGFLPVQPSRMLGAPPSQALEWDGVLPRGASLLLFTDGLVESRSADIDEGFDLLLAAAESASTSDPDALCDHLLSELTGAHRADDIALLVLTRL